MNKKQWVRLWVFISIVICVVVSTGMLMASADKSPQPPVSVIALPVPTVPVRLQNSYEMRRVFSGRVQARRVSDLGFDASGLLVNLLVEEGASVNHGELIAQLDKERLETRRTELNAARAEAEANLALADATLKRMQGVVKAGGVSHQELDIAREGQRAAQASLTLAKHRIDSLDVELRKTNLYAPFSGTVVVRFADEGRVIKAGEPIFRLQENGAAEIRIGVAGRTVGQLKVGDIYELKWRERAIGARLRAVLPVTEATTRTVDALFDAVEYDASLRSGDLITLTLTTSVAEQGTWLPITTLTEGERGLWNVYFTQPEAVIPAGLDATHRLVRRTVDVVYQETDRVFVRGAFGGQDRVVSSGLQRIVPGQWVRVSPSMVAQGGAAHE